MEFVDPTKSAVMEIDLNVALVNAVERTAFMTMRMTKLTQGMTNEACGILQAHVLIRCKDLRSRMQIQDALDQTTLESNSLYPIKQAMGTYRA